MTIGQRGRFRTVFASMPFGGIANFVQVDDIEDVLTNLQRLSGVLKSHAEACNKDAEELSRYRGALRSLKEIFAGGGGERGRR